MTEKSVVPAKQLRDFKLSDIAWIILGLPWLIVDAAVREYCLQEGVKH